MVSLKVVKIAMQKLSDLKRAVMHDEITREKFTRVLAELDNVLAVYDPEHNLNAEHFMEAAERAGFHREVGMVVYNSVLNDLLM